MSKKSKNSDAKAWERLPKGQPRHANASLPNSDGKAKRSMPKGQGESAKPSLPETIDAIRAYHRERNFAMEQRKRADLALGSYLRMSLGWSKTLQQENPEAAKRINQVAKDLIECGEKLAKGKAHPLSDTEEFKRNERTIMAALMAREPFDAVEREATKAMETLAAQLPAWESWGKDIRGFGARSLAVIIGEAGDLSAYPKKGHLWKRMGLAVFDGIRQGGLKKTAAKEDWIAHGYNKQRRSRMYVIGDVLMKIDGPYRAVYLARKEYERAQAEQRGLIVAPAAKIPAKRAAEFISDGHIHKRSQRYMEKRLLKDLWQAWRAATEEVSKDQTFLAAAEIPGDRQRIESEATQRVPLQAIPTMPSSQPHERKAISRVPRKSARLAVPTAHPIAAE